jgi:hypothetical protein
LRHGEKAERDFHSASLLRGRGELIAHQPLKAKRMTSLPLRIMLHGICGARFVQFQSMQRLRVSECGLKMIGQHTGSDQGRQTATDYDSVLIRFAIIPPNLVPREAGLI